MPQKSDAELTTEAQVIRDETTALANTKTRVYDILKNIIDSKPNNTVGGGGAWGTITGTLSAQTDLDSALDAIASAISNHMADTSDAHDASAISNVAAGNIAATDVQAAINELDTEKAGLAYLRRVREVTGTGAIVQNDDNGLIIFNSAGPFNFTIDQLTADVSGGQTTQVEYINKGAGAVTFVNGSGVTLAGETIVPGAVGTNYPSGYIYYDTATTPRHATAVIDADLQTIADLSPTNDDVLQRKAGVWTSRTMAQLKTDLGALYTTNIPFSILEAGLIYTNMPNSEQYLQGSGVYRRRFDATGFLEVRITALIGTIGTGANNPRMYPQYTTDLTAATGWTTIGAGTIASGDAITMLSTGEKASNWITLPAGAKADVLFRVAVNGGDGAGDPAMFNVLMQFRS